MTLRPSRFNRRVLPIISLAIAGVFLLGGYGMLVQQGPGEGWLSTAGGVAAIGFAVACMVAVAVLVPKAYIRVDDSTITFGPSLTSMAARGNSFDRREVAVIRWTNWPLTRRTTLFLRSDRSILRSTGGDFWGRDGLQTLANYLGVPFES
jgi:hypothetical protein